MVTTKKMSQKEYKKILKEAVMVSNQKAKEIDVLKFHLNNCIFNAELEKKKVDDSIMTILFSAIKYLPLKKETREFLKKESGIKDWKDEFGEPAMETNNESYFVYGLKQACIVGEGGMYLGSLEEYKKEEAKMKLVHKDLNFIASLVNVSVLLSTLGVHTVKFSFTLNEKS